MTDAANAVYLSSFFSETDVLIEATVPSEFNLIHALVERLVANHLPQMRPEPIVDAVLLRERSSPTIIGDGIALPHARIEGLERPYLALGIFPAGIPTAPDARPVRLVFLLLVPESQPARYLQILRAVANLLQMPRTVEKLISMTSGQEVMRFLRRSEMKLPDYICAADLMETQFESLRADEPLAAALNAFMLEGKVELPIVDGAGRLVGAVDTHALLGSFIPAGFRKLLPILAGKPANTMEGLASRLREAHQTPVRKQMKEEVCTCRPDTPAREIAADLAERNAVKSYVLDGEGRLVGIISLAGFFRRILKD